MATAHTSTLLDLVQAVSDFAANDEETVATVTYLVNSGRVRLCGNFAGARIDLTSRARVVLPNFSRPSRACQRSGH